MKKILLFFIALLGVFSLSSCSFNKGYENIDTSELRIMMNDNPNYVYIDVRTSDEFQENHIEGFVNYDYYKFDSLINDIESEYPKDSVLVIICRSGNRSSKAAKKLFDVGYATVYNVTGGINSY